MKSTLEDYQKVYRILEDDESKDIYLSRLSFLVSAHSKHIEPIVSKYLPDLPVYTGWSHSELIASMPKDKDIVLYGAGQYAKETLHYWVGDRRFIGFCCSTKEKQAHGYLGYPVMGPEELLERKDLVVFVNTYAAREEILQILQDGGYPNELIFSVPPSFPSPGPKYEAGQYFAPSFMKYEDEEVFVDAGCYDLNTSLELKKYCRHVKKVYAFEPDPKNYQCCLEKKEETNFTEAEILPFGTWSKRETICFQSGRSTNSKASEGGNCTVSVMPIDEAIAPKDRVTMIKMDVEGSELESLMGARKTILRDKPKLAVCIYHKPEDMTEIPLYIKKLVPEYRLYIRHYSNIGTETVLYAVMS